VAQPQNKDGQDEQIVKDVNSILVNNQTTEHTLSVDPDNPHLVIKVNVRKLSFMDMQRALKSFVSISGTGEVEIDLAGYWRYMIDKCIVNTEPSMNTTQLTSLNQYAGEKLASVLPQPQDLLAGPLGVGNEE